MSPEMAETPSRISRRKPEEMATARIMMKKDKATEQTAIFPLNRNLDAMNREACMRDNYFMDWRRIWADCFSTSSVLIFSRVWRHFFSSFLFPVFRATRTLFLTAG